MKRLTETFVRRAQIHIWRWVHRAGYSIRRNESFAFPDQSRLLEGFNVNTIFDIGANRGNTVCEYRAMFPHTHIHAFEPIPQMASTMAERFSDDPKCIVQNCAVCESVGTASFNVNSAQDTSSLLQTDANQIPAAYQHMQRPDQVITVPTLTIDSYCSEHNISHIDVLKLDIQGGELRALRGAANMLRGEAISLIYLEAFLLPFYKEQPLLGDICNELSQYSYTLHNIYNLGFRSTTGRCSWMDAIFVSPPMRSRSTQMLVSETKN